MTRYGYIGLGTMGSSMAEHLVGTGAEVTVFDLDNAMALVEEELGQVRANETCAACDQDGLLRVVQGASSLLRSVAFDRTLFLRPTSTGNAVR